MQSNLINMDAEGAIESPHINGVSVLSGLNLEKINGRSNSFPRDKANRCSVCFIFQEYVLDMR